MKRVTVEQRLREVVVWGTLMPSTNEVREHIPVSYDNLFNLFLSSRHAVKNIFSFRGSSPCPRGHGLLLKRSFYLRIAVS